MANLINEVQDDLWLSIFKLKALADLINFVGIRDAYKDTPSGISGLFIDELERMEAQVSLLSKSCCDVQIKG
jgi:hypothetical protein